MKKLLPLIIILVLGASGGVAGFYLRPPPPEIIEDDEIAKKPKKEAIKDVAFVKLNNQFVIPVVKNDRVKALVVLSLTLQTDASSTDALYGKEPKFRDAFIRVLFDHAYGGGFDGAFTTSPSLDALRHALLEVAKKVGGVSITDVLITDITRQDA